MVEIRIVKTKKQQKDFVKFANILYKENENYVPSIYKVEKNIFSHKKNPNLISNEIMGLLAYQEGRLVGRILCLKNRVEMSQEKIVRFSHFDCINDSEVSFALLDSLKRWALTLNAERIVGDLGFNDLMQCGVVFKNNLNVMPTFQQKINYEYYIEHLKMYGFNVVKKFNEYQMSLKDDDLENIDNDIDLLLSKNGLRFVDGDIKFKISMYGRRIFELLYDNSISNFPSVIDEKVYNNYFHSIKKLFDNEDFHILINNNDEVIGCMLVTRNTSLALQTTQGNVLASKMMYSVGGEFKNEYDISLLAIDKRFQNVVSEIMSKKLAKMFKMKDCHLIFSNLWINNDVKKQIFSQYFNIELVRSRALCKLELTNSPNDLIIKRTSKDLIGRPNNNVHKRELK